MSRHGSRDDQAAASLLFKLSAHGLRTVQNTGQVSADDLIPFLDARVKHASVGCPSSIGDHNVDLAEVLDDVLDELLNVFVVADIALVGLALDAVALSDVLGVLLAALGTRGVGDGDVGTHFCTSSSGFCADAGCAGGTGDDDNFAFEAEEVFETCVMLVVGSSTSSGKC